MKEIKKMKVAELRAELKRRGLPTDGLKAVLAASLSNLMSAALAGLLLTV